MQRPFAPRVLAVAGMAAGIFVLAASSIVAPAARAATAPHWRITRIVRASRDDSLESVTAVGPKSAWALGAPGVGGADVEHWDGTAWHHVPVPRGVSVGGLDNAPIAASPGKDAWIFPQRLGHIGLSFYEYNSALHWNGRSWRASSFPKKLIVTFAAAFSGSDTWAFGVVNTAQNGVVGYNARYNGHSWRKVALPGVPIGFSAVSRSDMWAIGPTLKTQNLATDRQVLIAMHWNGRSWRTLTLPKIKVAKGEDFSIGGNTVAASSRDVWWPYLVANDANDTSARGLLHWDGHSWRAIALPVAIGVIDAVTNDGHGGIWLAADTETKDFNDPQYWYHYSGGRWARRLVLSPRAYLNEVFGMAWIPGTRSVWAVGEADADQGNSNEGVIAKYGP
jgi:hypothetical protein